MKQIGKEVGKGLPKCNVYFVTLPLHHNGVLEIYLYPELLQKAYRELKQTLVVVGIANSRDEAFSLVEKIIIDVGWRSGEIPIAQFFKE